MRTMVASLAGQVHVRDTGRPNGSAVVLSSRLGGTWSDWDAVVALLAPHARVLVFDRPGTGGSGPALAPPTLAREVAVLDAVLDAGHDAGRRAVLVGHAVAALHVEAWARLRPSRVRGLVLVDPTPQPPGAGRPFDAPALAARWALRLRVDGAVARWGPAPWRWARRDLALTRAVLEELASYPRQASAVERLRAFRPLPPAPFTVLTPGRRARPEHEALAAMAPWGTTVLVPGSGHLVPVDRPDAVALAVLKALRGG